MGTSGFPRHPSGFDLTTVRSSFGNVYICGMNRKYPIGIQSFRMTLRYYYVCGLVYYNEGNPVIRITLNFIGLLIVAAMMTLISGCGQGKERQSDQTGGNAQVKQGFEIFEPVIGIDFYEVRRTFDTGISYDSIGFMQAPDWHIRFAAKDSVLIYSPEADQLFGYKMHHDHENYFHFGRESWRMVELHPDSVTIQQLSLRGLTVDRVKSNVYMKFYSERYIRENFGGEGIPLEDKITQLRKPNRQDTAFVMAMIERANRNPQEPDSAFASRNFAQLVSTNPALKIQKRKIQQSELTGESPSYEYLYPEYIITINPAYQVFNHDFSVVVDENGKLHLGEIFVMEEYTKPKPGVVQGIIDVYLHNWLKVTPAHTMGIPHASRIYLYVKGRNRD